MVELVGETTADLRSMGAAHNRQFRMLGSA